MKMKKSVLLFILLLSHISFSQTWDLIIPSSSYDGNKLNLSGSGYNRIDNKIYSLYWNSSNQVIQSFDLTSQTVQTINATNGPAELNGFTFDFENSRILAGRAGRDQTFSLPISGGAWSVNGTGSFDSESYGAQYFYNETNNSIGYFGGYGGFQAKNWIWENDGIQWNNVVPNDANCDNFTPPKRAGFNPTLGNPNEQSIYFFSSIGNCSGSQMDQSCPFGSPWATDLGVWCWLKDLWKYNYSANSFTQILPPNSPSVSLEGDLTYDYINNTFYLLGGFIPSPVYNPNYNTTFENGVLRYRVGIDNGFLPLTVSGNAPPTYDLNSMGTHGAYFDAMNDRIIWLRFDGVYSLDLGNVGLESHKLDEIRLSPNPNNGVFSIENNSQNEFGELEIMDLSGNIVYRNFNNQVNYDLSNLVDGMYFVLLKSDNLTKMIKFIKE
jgi:hypothetical protein